MDTSTTKREDYDIVKPGSAEVAFHPKRSTDDMFVGWNPPQTNEPNEKKGAKGIPRLAHKKSKTGCQRCRARRVKVLWPLLSHPCYQISRAADPDLLPRFLPSSVPSCCTIYIGSQTITWALHFTYLYCVQCC